MKEETRCLAGKFQIDTDLEIADKSRERIKNFSCLAEVVLMVEGFLIIMDHKTICNFRVPSDNNETIILLKSQKLSGETLSLLLIQIIESL